MQKIKRLIDCSNGIYRRLLIHCSLIDSIVCLRVFVLIETAMFRTAFKTLIVTFVEFNLHIQSTVNNINKYDSIQFDLFFVVSQRAIYDFMKKNPCAVICNHEIHQHLYVH